VGDAVFQFCAEPLGRRALNRHTACHTCQISLRSVRRVSKDPRHRLGQLGERLAAEHLGRRGFQIIERNYRTRWGELDLVAFDGRTLAFCEVKTRRAVDPAVSPLEAIGRRKCVRIRNMARSWLTERTERPYADMVRFDAIAVTFDSAGQLLAIEHVENSF
jgi:putative endonuclease